MKRWTNGLPGATKGLGANLALRGLSVSQSGCARIPMMARSKIAPLQRPNTLMQLSRSSVLELPLATRGRAIHVGTSLLLRPTALMSVSGPFLSWNGPGRIGRKPQSAQVDLHGRSIDPRRLIRLQNAVEFHRLAFPANVGRSNNNKQTGRENDDEHRGTDDRAAARRNRYRLVVGRRFRRQRSGGGPQDRLHLVADRRHRR